MRPTVRGLVWDLDDTLWQGAAPVPSPTAVRTLHTLDRRGILHAGTGRRDHTVALSRHGLTELFTVLGFGRDTTSGPIRALASTLDIPLETLALVAGDQMARAEVAAALPDVRCYPATMVERLPGLADFTPEVVTAETGERRHVVRAEQRRRTAGTTHPGTPASFLGTLDLELEIRPARAPDLLIARQFTATGRPPTPADLQALITKPDHEVLVATLRDRFGPYGVVGLAVLVLSESTTALELLMCDQVLATGAGAAFLDHIVARSLMAGRRPVADFLPTRTNRQLLVTLRFSGFQVIANAEGRMTLAIDPIRPPVPRRHPVRVVTAR